MIRDFYCLACTAVTEDVDHADTHAELWCLHCHATTAHAAVCNGGVKRRFRFNDFSANPIDYAGQTDSSVSAVYFDDDGKEHPVTDPGGGVTHEREKFRGDARAERRDRADHRMRRKYGREKRLVFDGGKRSHGID